MNRFSTFTKYGIQYIQDFNKSIVHMSITDFESIERKLQKLAEYEETEEQGLLINISCEGCKYNKVYKYEEFVKSKCIQCSRNHYKKWNDQYKPSKAAEAALKGGGAK